jgi:hypothetical protein
MEEPRWCNNTIGDFIHWLREARRIQKPKIYFLNGFEGHHDTRTLGLEI